MELEQAIVLHGQLILNAGLYFLRFENGLLDTLQRIL